MNPNTSPTMDTNSERQNPTSSIPAVRNMISVITQTPTAPTMTDTQIPIGQQSLSSISQYGLGNVYVLFLETLTFSPEQKREIDYLFRINCAY